MDYYADTLKNLTFPSPIADLSLYPLTDKEEISIVFEDGSRLIIKDDGQDCCEHRYITTDCTLTDFVGATIRNIRIEEGPTTESSYEVHNTQFLKIDTTNGTLDFVTHNEHNGYYGGFSIVATFKEGAKQ